MIDDDVADLLRHENDAFESKVLGLSSAVDRLLDALPELRAEKLTAIHLEQRIIGWVLSGEFPVALDVIYEVLLELRWANRVARPRC